MVSLSEVIATLSLSLMFVTSQAVQSQKTTQSQKTCTRLSMREKRELLASKRVETVHELHWTFWLLPYLQDNKQIEQEPQTQARSTHLYGPKKCSKLKDIDREYDCPARYVMHNDVNRIPENIVYADCVCDRCRHGNNNHAKRCQPVYTLTKVLRRGEDCVYRWAYDKVPVACTCKSEANIREAETVPREEVPIVQRLH